MKFLKAIQFLIIGFFILNSTFASSKAEASLWIKNHMKTVPSIRDLENTPALKELDQIVKSKRVLMLGEPDHYITEKWSAVVELESIDLPI